MIELLAFIELAKLNERNFDPHCAREEEAFYQGFGRSRLERFAALFLAILPMKKGRPTGSPSIIAPDQQPGQAASRMRARLGAEDASMRNCCISDMSASASLASWRLCSVVSSTMAAFFCVI